MTQAVDFPEPVFPLSVSERDPNSLPLAPCGVVEGHESHVWIGAWDHGDDDPRRCPGQVV